MERSPLLDELIGPSITFGIAEYGMPSRSPPGWREPKTASQLCLSEAGGAACEKNWVCLGIVRIREMSPDLERDGAL